MIGHTFCCERISSWMSSNFDIILFKRFRLYFYIIRAMKWMLAVLDCVSYWLEWWAQYAVALFWIKLIVLSMILFWKRSIEANASTTNSFIYIFFQHRETTLAVYAFSMIGMWIYTFTLNVGHISIVYVTSSLLG